MSTDIAIPSSDKARAIEFFQKKTKNALLARPLQKHSVKAKKIASILDSRGENPFGCQTRKVAAIFEEIIGEKIPSMELSEAELKMMVSKNEGAVFYGLTGSYAGVLTIIMPGTCSRMAVSCAPGKLVEFGSFWHNDEYARNGISKYVRKATDKEIATFVNSVNFVEPRIYDAFRKMITGA